MLDSPSYLYVSSLHQSVGTIETFVESISKVSITFLFNLSSLISSPLMVQELS